MYTCPSESSSGKIYTVDLAGGKCDCLNRKNQLDYTNQSAKDYGFCKHMFTAWLEFGDDIDCDLVGGTKLQVLKEHTDKPPLAVACERLQEPTSSPEAEQHIASLAQCAKGLGPGVFVKALGLLGMTPSDLLQAMKGTMGAIKATSSAAAKVRFATPLPPTNCVCLPQLTPWHLPLVAHQS